MKTVMKAVMNSSVRAKALLTGCVVAASPMPTAAGARRFSIGGSIGFGHLPLSDWEAFIGSGANTDYEADHLGLYWGLSGRVAFGGRHSVKLALERITTSAWAASVSELTVPGGTQTYILEWEFASLPMSLSYQVDLLGANARTSPGLGVGAGVYRSRVESKVRTLHTTSTEAFPPSEGERDGWGYGIHGYVGQRASITGSAFLSALLRARWADGMGFTDGAADIDVDFTGVDVVVGLGWEF